MFELVDRNSDNLPSYPASERDHQEIQRIYSTNCQRIVNDRLKFEIGLKWCTKEEVCIFRNIQITKANQEQTTQQENVFRQSDTVLSSPFFLPLAVRIKILVSFIYWHIQ